MYLIIFLQKEEQEVNLQRNRVLKSNKISNLEEGSKKLLFMNWKVVVKIVVRNEVTYFIQNLFVKEPCSVL